MKKSAQRRPVFAPTPEALAQQGAQALQLGRFKEAAEIFKQLARQDPRPEWTARLHDAYAGRARGLAEKGMFKEAAMVLENTLAPDGSIREPLLYFSCMLQQGQHQKARRAALQAIAHLSGPDAARMQEAAAALALAAPSPEPTPPTDDSWGAQTRAAQAALQAWLQGSPPEALDPLLARVSLRSPFGPMRLVLKGLIAPPDKAHGLLAMVPPSSPFAGVRDAAEAVLADDQELLARWNQLRPAQQHFVGEARGLPRAMSTLLGQIADAERRGPAALFALLSRRDLPLPKDELRTACLNLLPAVPEQLAAFQRQFGPLEPDERARIVALSAEAQHNWDEAVVYWNLLISILEQEKAPQARLALGVVLRHLADLAREHPQIDDEQAEEDDDLVVWYLERSIEADPDCLPATLALLERHRNADDQKDWMPAAEAAARRFPGNTTVLLHAVDAAVARDAFKKAGGFARQVLTVDPINQPARQRMIELQLAHARKQVRSGRIDLAGKTLTEAAEWERADTPSAALRIGRALVAMMAEPGEAAQQGVRAAVQVAGGGTVGWFHAVLQASLMGLPNKQLQPLIRELDAAQKSEPDRATILALTALLGQKEVRDSRKAAAPALRPIEPFLAGGSRIAWSPAEFQAIADLLAHLREFRILFRYAQDALHREPGNLTARFYQILARAEGKTDRLTASQETELLGMLESASAGQDFHLFNRVQRLVFGPAFGKAARGGNLSLPDPDGVDEVDIAALVVALAGELPAARAREIRSLVQEVGRYMAIEVMTAGMADGEMDDMLSPEQIERICVAMIDKAMQSGRQKGRRR